MTANGPKSQLARHTISDMSEGVEFSLIHTITDDDLDDFAKISGDISPLHMDGAFAQSRGFNRRVAHGALLISYLSRLIGVHFPGENALIQTMNIKFSQPAYPGDKIKIHAWVDQVSESVNSILLKVKIENHDSSDVVLRGKIQVGFTSAKS